MMTKFNNKLVLITGGSSGIGLETAELLHEEGARVIVADLNQPENSDIEFIHHDVSLELSWRNLFAALKDIGNLDILINNAGILGFQNPEHIDLSSYRNLMKINVEGVILGCKFAIHAMKDLHKDKAPGKGSVIINVASLAGTSAVPMAIDYASSKAFVRYYSKSVAIYCCEMNYNIRCNSISPGAILTPIWDTVLGSGEDRQKNLSFYQEMNPMKSWGTPRDVAHAISYLASDEARFITGSDMIIDGGQYAKGQ